MAIKVDVEWSWSWQGQFIKIHTVARASNGWKATTDRLYRREPEDKNKTDMELAVEQAEKATEDIKGRFGYENPTLLLENKINLIETGKNAIHASSASGSGS